MLCGVYLYMRFGRYKDAGGIHECWQGLWLCGCFVSAVGVVVYLLHGDGFPYMLIMSISSLLWIAAFIAYRRAKAQDAVPMPRYDDPQEGIWPPPPANPP